MMQELPPLAVRLIEGMYIAQWECKDGTVVVVAMLLYTVKQHHPQVYKDWIDWLGRYAEAVVADFVKANGIDAKVHIIPVGPGEMN